MAIVSIQYDLNKVEESAEYDIARNAMKYRRFISKLLERSADTEQLNLIADCARDAGLPNIITNVAGRPRLVVS